MAQKDADRLLKDLDQNQDLYGKMQDAAKQVLAVAKQHGYDVNENEVREAFNKKFDMNLPMTGGQSDDPGQAEQPGGPGADPLTTFFISEPPGH